jgi:hypothetical protein
MRVPIVLGLICWPALAQDFLKFPYRPACLESKGAVRVRRGVFERDSPPERRLSFRVLSIHFGDLDRDGRQEAIVVTACSTGGSGEMTEGILYSIGGDPPRELARLAPGDRALGGIAGVEFRDRLRWVRRKHGEAAFCPVEIRGEEFQWRNGKLEPTGRTERQPLPGK